MYGVYGNAQGDSIVRVMKYFFTRANDHFLDSDFGFGNRMVLDIGFGKSETVGRRIPYYSADGYVLLHNNLEHLGTTYCSCILHSV